MSIQRGLAADIGGTNTRLALVENGRVLENTIARFRNADFETPEAAIGTYLSEAGRPACASAVIAIAAPIDGPAIRMTNHPWTFSADCIGKVLGGANITFLNDFEALAYSLDKVPTERLQPVYEPSQKLRSNATRLVVGDVQTQLWILDERNLRGLAIRSMSRRALSSLFVVAATCVRAPLG